MRLSGVGELVEECEKKKRTNNAILVGKMDAIYAGDIIRVSEGDSCL